MQYAWIVFLCALVISQYVFANVQYYEPNSELFMDLSLLNANSEDLNITLSIPSANGWGAVGIGDRMSGALMFVLLPGGKSNGVISVRSTKDHSMPIPLSNINFQLGATTGNASTLLAQGICKNCTTYLSSTTTAAQPFIWAIGPGPFGVEGAGASANINEHANYGKFFVNMTRASQQGTIFRASEMIGPAGNLVTLHAVVLVSTFFVTLPLAVALLRFSRFGFKIHWIIQTVSLCVSLVALGVAIYMSKASDEYKSLSEGHQILGIIVVILLIPQGLLGRAHHINFKRFGKRSMASYMHLWLGRAIIPLGVLVATLGFLLEGSVSEAVIVAFIGASIYIVIFITIFYKTYQKKRENYEGGSAEWYPLASNATSHENQVR